MPFFSYNNIRISGIASAVPVERVTVQSFADKYGEQDIARFTEMTGIKEFRKTSKHQTCSDLGFAAADRMLREKNIERDSIGALVFVSHSTDYRRPATACVLHKRLGLSKNCAAFDVGLGCSAVVYGIQIMCSMMASSDIERGLLVIGESVSKMANPEDHSVNMLFGDGGAAILLEKSQSAGQISVLLKSDGNGYRSIIAPAGGFRNMDAVKEDTVWPDGNIRNLYNTYMNGTDVFSFTISDVPKAVKEFFEKTGTSPDDYDCFAFHQANKYIHRQLSKKLKIPMEKMPLCIDRYGNTSAPAAAMALCDAYGTSNSNEAVRTLFCCFGVGLSWGVVSANIMPSDIYPILETDEIFEEGIINTPF